MQNQHAFMIVACFIHKNTFTKCVRKIKSGKENTLMNINYEKSVK